MIKRVGKTKSGGQRSEIIDSDGICSCLSATDYKQPKQILEPQISVVGNVNLGNNESNNRVYSPDGLCPTLNTMQGGHRQPKILEPLICASRGRNPDNPSSRKAGDHTEQRIEVNAKGLSNTLTTVQKDNLVIEPNFEEMLKGTNYARNFGSKGKVCKEDEICGTLQAAMGSGGGNIPLTYNNFRIRKLTPRECWRLMGFKDHYFDKVKGISNTQLYKQAGNSIVVDVLRYIFRELKSQYPDYFKENEWGSDL